MDEHLKALQFYRVIVQALRSTGIKKILVTMLPNGELAADVMLEEKTPPSERGKTGGLKC